MNKMIPRGIQQFLTFDEDHSFSTCGRTAADLANAALTIALSGHFRAVAGDFGVLLDAADSKNAASW